MSQNLCTTRWINNVAFRIFETWRRWNSSNTTSHLLLIELYTVAVTEIRTMLSTVGLHRVRHQIQHSYYGAAIIHWTGRVAEMDVGF